MDVIHQYAIDRAKELRRRKGLTLHQFSVILGKSASFIGNIENPKNPARYNLGHIRKLAEHFDISPRYFIMEHHSNPYYSPDTVL